MCKFSKGGNSRRFSFKNFCGRILLLLCLSSVYRISYTLFSTHARENYPRPIDQPLVTHFLCTFSSLFMSDLNQGIHMGCIFKSKSHYSSIECSNFLTFSIPNYFCKNKLLKRRKLKGRGYSTWAIQPDLEV